jgi:hypothetical protein
MPRARAWAEAAAAAHDLSEAWAAADDGTRAAGAAALGDVLTATASAAPERFTDMLDAADRAWSHASRPPVSAERAAVAARLREAARSLAASSTDVGEEDPGACRAAVTALARGADQVANWYRDRAWGPQERAARQVAQGLLRALG